MGTRKELKYAYASNFGSFAPARPQSFTALRTASHNGINKLAQPQEGAKNTDLARTARQPVLRSV